MDENELKKAIEKEKLPLTSEDKALLVIGVVCTLLVFIINVKNWDIKLIAILSGMPLIFFILYLQILSMKKLTTYVSNLPPAQKLNISIRIINEFKAENLQKWRFDEPVLNILYDENGYYINTIKNTLGWRFLSKATTEEIISKIKKLEAEL